MGYYDDERIMAPRTSRAGGSLGLMSLGQSLSYGKRKHQKEQAKLNAQLRNQAAIDAEKRSQNAMSMFQTKQLAQQADDQKLSREMLQMKLDATEAGQIRGINAGTNTQMRAITAGKNTQLRDFGQQNKIQAINTDTQKWLKHADTTTADKNRRSTEFMHKDDNRLKEVMQARGIISQEGMQGNRIASTEKLHGDTIKSNQFMQGKRIGSTEKMHGIDDKRIKGMQWKDLMYKDSQGDKNRAFQEKQLAALTPGYNADASYKNARAANIQYKTAEQKALLPEKLRQLEAVKKRDATSQEKAEFDLATDKKLLKYKLTRLEAQKIQQAKKAKIEPELIAKMYGIPIEKVLALTEDEPEVNKHMEYAKDTAGYTGRFLKSAFMGLADATGGSTLKTLNAWRQMGINRTKRLAAAKTKAKAEQAKKEKAAKEEAAMEALKKM